MASSSRARLKAGEDGFRSMRGAWASIQHVKRRSETGDCAGEFLADAGGCSFFGADVATLMVMINVNNHQMTSMVMNNVKTTTRRIYLPDMLFSQQKWGKAIWI